MKPLDDELRAVLSSRADALALVPDPIVGIERRAKRMRRNRIAASVAGTALAVSGIAVAVPALLTDRSTDSLPQYAETPAPDAPDPVSRYALDPADPWPYRGVPQAQLGEGTLETIEREYAVRFGGDASAVEVTPLFGQVHEPSQSVEVVFLARFVDGELRWGVARSSEAGPEFVHDEDLFESERLGLAVALPGDEVARLLVVAAPGTTVEHAPAGEALTATAPLADGVGTVPLQRGLDGDYYAVRAPDGSVVTQVGAPDPSSAPGG